MPGCRWNAVGDQLAHDRPGAEQRDHRTGLAVVRRPHAVEQVRPDRRAGRHPGQRLLVRRVRVAHGRDHPRSASSAMLSSAPGSSGAIVTIRTAPAPSRISSVSSSGGGLAEELGILGAAADRGQVRPSKCTPAITPSATSGAYASVALRISSYGELTRLASIVVVPCARWNAARARAWRRIAGGERVPAAAVAVQVHEAGHDHSRRRRPALT
jgi:hypothetical protein